MQPYEEAEWKTVTVELNTEVKCSISKVLHCVQKKTPTHIFFHISMNYLWI